MYRMKNPSYRGLGTQRGEPCTKKNGPLFFFLSTILGLGASPSFRNRFRQKTVYLYHRSTRRCAEHIAYTRLFVGARYRITRASGSNPEGAGGIYPPFRSLAPLFVRKKKWRNSTTRARIGVIRSKIPPEMFSE